MRWRSLQMGKFDCINVSHIGSFFNTYLQVSRMSMLMLVFPAAAPTRPTVNVPPLHTHTHILHTSSGRLWGRIRDVCFWGITQTHVCGALESPIWNLRSGRPGSWRKNMSNKNCFHWWDGLSWRTAQFQTPWSFYKVSLSRISEGAGVEADTL